MQRLAGDAFQVSVGGDRNRWTSGKCRLLYLKELIVQELLDLYTGVPVSEMNTEFSHTHIFSVQQNGAALF